VLPLTTIQVYRRLKAIPGWTKRANTIRRMFQLRGFLDSIDFVNRVAMEAEKSNHHPDIEICWNKVTLTLTTHSKGGLTGKDFSMARQCSGIFSKYFESQ
jgi:4a-hydroxytetrahydrobiopterin dehydratase